MGELISNSDDEVREFVVYDPENFEKKFLELYNQNINTNEAIRQARTVTNAAYLRSLRNKGIPVLLAPFCLKADMQER